MEPKSLLSWPELLKQVTLNKYKFEANSSYRSDDQELDSDSDSDESTLSSSSSSGSSSTSSSSSSEVNKDPGSSLATSSSSSSTSDTDSSLEKINNLAAGEPDSVKQYYGTEEDASKPRKLLNTGGSQYR